MITPLMLLMLMLSRNAIQAGLQPAPIRSHTSPLPAPASGLLDAGFVENRGQWDPRIRFAARVGRMRMWLMADGAICCVDRSNSPGSAASGGRPQTCFKMKFVDGSSAELTGSVPIPGILRYFIGNRRDRWVRETGRFSEVVAKDIYPGISVRYYVSMGAPRYDLIVDPGADPDRIAVRFEGIDRISVLPNGNLQMETPAGSVETRGLLAY